MRFPTLALRDGNIERGFGVVYRAARDQAERATLRRIVAEVYFEIMITRQTLILAPTERVQSFIVQGVYKIRDVLTVIICGAGDWMWCRYGGETQFVGWNNKPLVYKNFSAFGMIDRHQADVIVVIDFPKLGRNSQI